ncbi:MAG: hypothetical protein HOV81_00640 [Kofleriaceae bacterium]|nr:hypothetical protein [Kofleriaceae bacterium]
MELVEEPHDEHPDDASPLVQALQTFNALLALEPAKHPIEKPVPSKATVAASVLPPPSQRMRPPMPTAELKLRTSMPLLNGCAKQSALLPALAGDVRASLQAAPSIHVRGSMPSGMRVVIPPLQVRPRGTPAVGTRTKQLPAVPRVGEPSRPSELRVQIPPRATHEMPAVVELGPESSPVDVVELPASDASECSIAISPAAPSSRRRRHVVFVASSLGAVGIALAVVIIGGDSGASTDDAPRVEMVVLQAAAEVTSTPPATAPMTASAPVASPPAVAAQVMSPMEVAAAPVATPTAATPTEGAPPPAVAILESVSSEVAAPAVEPSERAVRTTVVREPRESKRAHSHRHADRSNPVSIAASTCAAEPKHKRTAKAEDLDSPFPE